jgi:hypothetical protein
MNTLRLNKLTVPDIALVAVTRGAIGFGAGLLLADKIKRQRRKAVGWSLFLSGLASTIPIAMHLFRRKKKGADETSTSPNTQVTE